MKHKTLVSEKMFNTLNEHYNFEMYSAYTYLALSSACHQMGWKGAAHWFHEQFREEHEHGLKIFEYILEKHGDVKIEGIKKPEINVSTLLDAFRIAYDHEQLVTEKINSIVAEAFEEKDFGTFEFMQWFLTEQRQEESSVDDIVDRLEMAGKCNTALIAIDEKLLSRAIVARVSE